MIIIRQKEFGWWSNINKNFAIKNAKKGVKYNPSWSKYISEEEYKKNMPLTPAEKKVQKEKDNIKDLIENFPYLKQDILGLQKLSEDKSILSLEPKWGDGDEYPVFVLSDDWVDTWIDNGCDETAGDFYPILIWHYQYERLGINPQKKYWAEEDHPERKINLKQYLLKVYKNELQYYINVKKKDEYGWEPGEYDEVIEWIKALIGGVQKYLR